MSLVKPEKKWLAPELVSRTVLIILMSVTYGLVANHVEAKYQVEMPSLGVLSGD